MLFAGAGPRRWIAQRSAAGEVTSIAALVRRAAVDGLSWLPAVETKHLARDRRQCSLVATNGARPILTGNFELSALDKLGIQPIGVPLVSEYPEDKIRHHPERLAAAITALGQGKLGAFRARADVGGM